MWVVKLGGSLFKTAHLKGWLAVLAQTRPLVVVPGGGPFADQVREAQTQWRFDDTCAHIMALLAMEQFGRMLCALQPGLVAVANRSQIDEVLQRGETPVWMPSAMVMSDAGIEESWRVTSDSLAAWLCAELDMNRLLLVKSVSLQGEDHCADELARAGIIDSQLGGYLQQFNVHSWIMAREEHGRFRKLQGGDMEVATKVVAVTGGASPSQV
jgi:aspartokinase-like uncharacterized kinase